MKSAQDSNADACPFQFNFDPLTFKVGDLVSYRVDSLGDFPFIGSLVEVGEDHVVISPTEAGRHMRGSRESRPMVAASEAID